MPVDSDHEKSFQMGARERLATSVVQVIFKILFKIDFGNFHEFFDQSEQALQICLFICYCFFSRVAEAKIFCWQNWVKNWRLRETL